MTTRDFRWYKRNISLGFALHYYVADIICKLVGHHWYRVGTGQLAWWNCARCERYSETNPTTPKRHA